MSVSHTVKEIITALQIIYCFIRQINMSVRKIVGKYTTEII